MYCNRPIDWSAGHLKIVPVSSHEAESAVAAKATKATCFARALLRSQGRKIYGPTPMLGDNDALYKTVHHEGHSARVRHYERTTLLFKRAVLLLILAPFKISDTDMFLQSLSEPLASKAASGSSGSQASGSNGSQLLQPSSLPRGKRLVRAPSNAGQQQIPPPAANP